VADGSSLQIKIEAVSLDSTNCKVHLMAQSTAASDCRLLRAVNRQQESVAEQTS
jgi:hypothetical protein